MDKSVRLAFVTALASLLAGAPRLFAASYFMIPDEDLIRRTPVVVRATAQQSRVVDLGGLRTETRTTFAVEQVVRGSAGPTIEVALPGGTLPSGAGSYAWMPGIPSGDDDVLFLYPRPDGVYGVSELELGIFEVQYDSSGTAFAVRPRFQSAAQRSGSRSLDSVRGAPAERPRELRAFLAKIAGEALSAPVQAPRGALQTGLVPVAGRAIHPMWNNLNSTLVRWNNGVSVSVGYVDDDTSDEMAGGTGPQAHLSGGGGGLTQLEKAVSHWDDDPSSDINLSLSAGSKAITIHTDNVSEFGGSGIPCSLGVVGLTGVSWSSPNQTYKGESYRTLAGADVYLRRWDCASSSYLSSAFENVATHELGHSLGLDHPDQGTSPHDHTSGDISGAVMISTGDYNRATGLGSDDVEGICYLYGACTDTVAPPPSGSAPVASFSYSPSSPGAGTAVSFSDTSSGSPASWTWDFGDPGSGSLDSSTSKGPTHVFASSGTYTVRLTAGNSFGTGSVSRNLAIGAASTYGCQTSTSTLCLQSARFSVRVAWQALNQGTSGNGVAIPLTLDTGAFWFFNSGNLELVVKVLDGRPINGHFWVFYGSLSDVQYTITVTDTQTGAFRTYKNPQNTFASAGDTTAF